MNRPCSLTDGFDEEEPVPVAVIEQDVGEFVVLRDWDAELAQHILLLAQQVLGLRNRSLRLHKLQLRLVDIQLGNGAQFQFPVGPLQKLVGQIEGVPSVPDSTLR